MKMNGYLQLILISLLFLQIYTQLESSKNYQGPDYSKEIEKTIKRYSREANQPISKIKQRVFERKIDNFKVLQYFKTSDVLKTKVECAGLCLSLSDCFAFEGFEREADTTCNLIHKQDICINANQNQSTVYVGLDQTDNTIKPCQVSEVFYKGFRSTENPNYATDCNLIPSNAVYIKVVMGSVVDYFKPVEGKTYCEMLQSNKLHQWSSDGKNWVIPMYHTSHLGGSSFRYPDDGRNYLSFWGGNGNNGGCCHYSFNDISDWKRSFNIFYGIEKGNGKEGTYIGCYVDDEDRDLNFGPKKYGYKQETCNTACQAYSYYALQNNGWCVCGNSYSTKSNYALMPDSECGGAHGLGGTWRNSVYATCPGGLHLAPRGSNTCDFGKTVSKEECKDAALAFFPNPSTTLQVGSGGSCFDGSWGQVPVGCSVQSGVAGTAHYKTSGDTGPECIHEMYQLVCRYNVEQPDASYSNIGKVSYAYAKKFCVDQGKDLCSFKTYCPDGVLSQPLRGKGLGTDVWAAISDLENDWVQISDSRICQRHSVLYGHPTWATGCCNNNEVLCCELKN